ncbi:MAG: Ig-like domain-containing protein [Vicinamibacterales bacterium]
MIPRGTTRATGTATLSNGTTQLITTGWRSDAPAVATVTDSGEVTGVARGLANVYVVYGERQGQAQMKVTPGYEGIWGGTRTYLTCTQTAAIPSGFCPRWLPGLGGRYPTGFLVAQKADSLSWQWWEGTTSAGVDIWEPALTFLIEGDGTVIATREKLTDYSSFRLPIILQESERWRFDTAGDGFVTGDGVIVYRLAGSSAEVARATTQIVRMRKGCPPTC